MTANGTSQKPMDYATARPSSRFYVPVLIIIIIITLFIPSTSCSEIKQKNIKHLERKRTARQQGALTVDPYTTRHNSVNCTSMRYKL